MTIDPQKLHRESLVIDSHNDSVVAHLRRYQRGLGGETGADRVDRAGAVSYLRQITLESGHVQLDIDLMRAGGLDAAFFAVDTTRAWGNHLLYALDALGYLRREIREHEESLTIAR
ncbi:MAG: hypothetical protein VX733_11525, partial [Candidatus Latescibacterota bacterium]|nr:hypothetical protein [Candidatus Latescibacterota bacterium]